MVNMNSRTFTVSYWGMRGVTPDPEPTLVFTEIREPGPDNSIWTAFSSTGVCITSENAPRGFNQYAKTKIAELMHIYICYRVDNRSEEEHNK